MSEPSIHEIRQEYAKALAMIARLVRERDDAIDALKAAEQFLYPEIHRGPSIDGWQNTVNMVCAAIAKVDGAA